eukprot:scaffold66402_cov27-Phaeocystis_antarctica.AAC.1
MGAQVSYRSERSEIPQAITPRVFGVQARPAAVSEPVPVSVAWADDHHDAHGLASLADHTLSRLEGLTRTLALTLTLTPNPNPNPNLNH